MARLTSKNILLNPVPNFDPPELVIKIKRKGKYKKYIVECYYCGDVIYKDQEYKKSKKGYRHSKRNCKKYKTQYDKTVDFDTLNSHPLNIRTLPKYIREESYEDRYFNPIYQYHKIIDQRVGECTTSEQSCIKCKNTICIGDQMITIVYFTCLYNHLGKIRGTNSIYTSHEHCNCPPEFKWPEEEKEEDIDSFFKNEGGHLNTLDEMIENSQQECLDRELLDLILLEHTYPSKKIDEDETKIVKLESEPRNDYY
jgi:hypothetical protein